MTKTVVGVFDSSERAYSAQNAVLGTGIDPSHCHLTTADTAAESDETRPRHYGETKGGVSHFFSRLFGADDSEEVGTYSEAVRRGGVVLAVDLPDDADTEPVCDALENAGAIDIEQQAQNWRQQGWTGYDSQAKPYTAEEIAAERNTVLPIVEEQLEVGKQQVHKGAVRVFTRTVETPVHETVSLREEHATVERHPVDRPATPEDLKAFGEKSIEVEETEERAVVSKTARVVEEVVVGKEISERTETIDDTVRRTEVETERRGGPSDTSMRAYEDFEPDYRQHFQSSYASQGGRYEDYTPAYRYGYGLASDARYQNRSWQDIEPDVQRDWETRYPDSAWERFKLAVRHGWERVTGNR